MVGESRLQAFTLKVLAAGASARSSESLHQPWSDTTYNSSRAAQTFRSSIQLKFEFKLVESAKIIIKPLLRIKLRISPPRGAPGPSWGGFRSSFLHPVVEIWTNKIGIAEHLGHAPIIAMVLLLSYRKMGYPYAAALKTLTAMGARMTTVFARTPFMRRIGTLVSHKKCNSSCAYSAIGPKLRQLQ